MLPRIVPSIDRLPREPPVPMAPLPAKSPSAPAWATSKPPSSARPVSPRANPKTPTAPAASCSSTPGRKPVVSRSGLLTTVAYQIAGEPAAYALEGSIAVAGSLVQWLRDNSWPDRHVSGHRGPGRDRRGQWRCLLRPRFLRPVRPVLALRCPRRHCRTHRLANKGHLARAVLEATAYQTRDVLDAMRRDSGVDLTNLRVDGGMAANDLLMQFQADVLNAPGRSPQSHRNDGARRGIRGRAGGRVLE